MKKHNEINYHAIREAVAAGILRVGKEDGKTNLADILTKMIVGQKRWDFCFHLFCCSGPTAANGSHRWRGFIILCQVWCSNSPCQVAS
jgi:hypothetical protein